MIRLRKRCSGQCCQPQKIQSTRPGKYSYGWILPAFLLTVVGLPCRDLRAEVFPVVAKVQQSSKFKGKISDTVGDPLPGATVQIKGSTKGVIADMDGNFEFDDCPINSTLVVSYIGMETKEIKYTGQKFLNIVMEAKTDELEEVTVVAFAKQKKESVLSSITTVKPAELKVPSSNLTTAFAGRVAGLISYQTSGEPGKDNASFFIRGITTFGAEAKKDPLILIDGIELSTEDLARLNTDDIASFTIMKDATATALYGARGANGVISVTTKEGKEGKVSVNARVENSFSSPTKRVKIADPVTFMRMQNEAIKTRDPMGLALYSEEKITMTERGLYPDIYPATDWYDTMFKNTTINQRANLSISGGGTVARYYVAANISKDNGNMKVDKRNNFNSNINLMKYAVRSNVNVNLTKTTELILRMSATFDEYTGPIGGGSTMYKEVMQANPVLFKPYYEPDEQYAYANHILFGNYGSANYVNPYALALKGYNDYSKNTMLTQFEFKQKLDMVTEGLFARVKINMDRYSEYSVDRNYKPFFYNIGTSDLLTNSYTLIRLNPSEGTEYIDYNPGNRYIDTSFYLEAAAEYNRTFEDKHTVNALLVYTMRNKKSGIADDLQLSLPNRNIGLAGRLAYNYDSRYFAEFDFGYNGSERFAKHNRMGFFPAVGMAWVTSSEPFMSSVSSVIDFLKFRVSYGKVGNDGIISSPRFAYAPSFGASSGYFDPQAGSGGRAELMPQQVINYGNDNIKWEIAEQLNFGLETKFFKGLVELNIDAYQEIRHNIIGYRSNIPANTGIAYEQLANIGKSRSRGIDFSGKIQHAFNKDLWVILNGTFTYNKVIYRAIEEATEKPDWQRKVGKEISQPMGYIAEGLFQDEAEIKNSPKQNGDVMPGDIRYRDINGDGYIDVNDATFIGFPETPGIIYGFQGFVNYKNFEFNFAFQGAGRRSFFMDPRKLSPFVDDHAMLTAIYKDHWSDDNMAKKPFWPRLSTYNLVAHNPEEDWYNSKAVETRKSTYFMRSCHFLRCTSLELAYNMPQNLMKRWKLQNMKFFVRANNPFLFSNFKVWDVELGEDGFNYPIQKTYALGLNFSF